MVVDWSGEDADVEWSRDGDVGAVGGARLGGDFAAGVVEDEAVEEEAEAEAFVGEVDGGFGAGEGLEELINFVGVDAFAVVADADLDGFFFGLAGDDDLSAGVGEFDGVVEDGGDDKGEEG